MGGGTSPTRHDFSPGQPFCLTKAGLSAILYLSRAMMLNQAKEPEMASIYGDYEVDSFFRNASVSFSGGRCIVSISHPWREKVYEADAKTMRVESIRERVAYGGIDASGKPFKGWSRWHSPWDASLAPEACIGDDFELARWQAGEEREKARVSCCLRRYAEVHC